MVELYPKQASPDAETSSSLASTTELVSHEEASLNEVRATGWISTKVCVQRLGIASATAKRTIVELVHAGILIKEGAGPSTRYRLK